MSLSVLRHLLCMALLLILAGCDGGNLKTASLRGSHKCGTTFSWI